MTDPIKMTQKILCVVVLLAGILAVSISTNTASAQLSTGFTEDFESYNDGQSPDNFTYNYAVIYQPQIPEINTNEVDSTATNKFYKIHMSSFREPDRGAANSGTIESSKISPHSQEYSVDILGKNLVGHGGESYVGATILYGIVYDTDDGNKLIGVRTHTTNNKNVTFGISLSEANSSLTSQVILNNFTPINTWKTFSGNVKTMYEENGFGNYSDVNSWTLILGGTSNTSQIHGRANSFEGHYDNIEIPIPPMYCGELGSHYTIINGTESMDYLVGNSNSSALILGNGGNDIIKTYGSGHCIFGGSGNDFIMTSDGNTVYGGSGDDSIHITGNSAAYGETGDDSIFVAIPTLGYVVDGGVGTDTCVSNKNQAITTVGCETTSAAGSFTVYANQKPLTCDITTVLDATSNQCIENPEIALAYGNIIDRLKAQIASLLES